MSSTPAPEIHVGAEIAGYLVERLISRGGMGVVYLARDLRLHRRVALKFLSPDLVENDAFRRRFVSESRLAASLDHPNIVPIYGAGQDAGRLWIAMRYVEGVQLRTRMNERGTLPTEEALKVITGVAKALDAAHARGLVHRDVKPGNIMVMLDPSGTIDHVYLTDFGLTKVIGESSGITDTGQFVGTVNYVAPEQIEGNSVDGRADQYSLACVLQEALTGEAPFARPDEVATIYAHLNGTRPSIQTARPDLPLALDEAVAKGLARDPADRFATCAAFVRAVRDALAEEKTTRLPMPAAGPPSEPDPAAGLARTRARSTAPAPDLTIVTPVPSVTSEDRRRAKHAKRGRRRVVTVLALILAAVAGAKPAVVWLLSDDPGEQVSRGGSAARPGDEFNLTKNEAADVEPTWFPDGSQVFFSSNRRGTWDVLAVNVDGSDLRPLATGPNNERMPAVSPNGDTIAFVSDLGDDQDLWLMDADGSDRRRITRVAGEDFDPAWSPDSERIAFVSTRSGDPDIFVMSPERTLLQLLVSSPSPDLSPAWSPDGQTVAFVRVEEGFGRIYVVPTSGGVPQPVTDGSADDRSPAWLSNGRIAFVRSGPVPRALYLVNPDNGLLATLVDAPGDYEDIALSADGRGLLFITRRDGNSEVYVRILA